ncbi:MAG TPA: GatB/YqeY domain-containing protein, partial [Acidimicrobiia bacterium]
YDSSKDDEVVQGVIESYSKRMQKSITEYEGYGERGADMAEKLRYEVDYLSRWMPQKLGEDETRALIEAKIAELGVAGDEKAAGRVTGMIMKDHKDDVDGALVNRLVRESLAR